jgi:ABC-2 type transport system ATP-binding protein
VVGAAKAVDMKANMKRNRSEPVRYPQTSPHGDSASDAIDVTGLVKMFGRTRALDGLNLQVPVGEVHGFLGPNGAGKSTTIRVLLGLLRPDAGRVRLLGGDPWRDAVALHRRLAYVPGDVSLWPNLTGGEAIDLLARLRGGLDQARRATLCERFDLDTSKKGRTYSKGNRQKVALVAALASNVELLILDEPTAGLDPLMEAVFQDCIREAKEDGRTVLLSSHILGQVEKLCDRVSIIRQGVVVETGVLSEMRHLRRTTIDAEVERAVTGLSELDGVHEVRTEESRVRFTVDGEHMDKVIAWLAPHGVRSLLSRPPTLEELFMRHYGDELAAGSDGGRTAAADAGAER